MRRYLKIVLTVFSLAMIVSLIPAEQGDCAPSESMRFSMGSGGQGGTYFAVAISLSQLLGKYIPGMEINVEVTGGAVDNSSLVGTGQARMGIATGDMVYKSVNGMAPFKKKLTDVKVLFAGLQPGAVQATVLENSKINSVFDLKGKRVGVGPISGPGQVVEDLIYAAGIPKGSFTPSYVGFSQAVQQLADRNLDCAIAMSGAPVAAIKELGAMNKYRMLSIEDQVAQKFLAKYPFYFRFEIAEGVYGLGYPVRTVAGYNTVIVTAKMSDDFAYKIIKAVFDNLEEFKKTHPSLNYLSLKTGAEAAGSLPYHPGAVKFFKDKGVEIKAK